MRGVVVLGPILVCLSSTFGQVSPFNDLGVPAEKESYRLILSGHLHGASNDRSGYPATTILASLDLINGLGADLFLSTGDLFLDPEKEHEQYERAFFSRLQVPLFNAPGNHDRNAYYERTFGATHTSIAIGDDRIILLDTERKDGSMDEEQLGTLQTLLNGPAPARIFIISHRPIWAEDDERYGPLFEGNTRSFLNTNYVEEVRPLIEALAERSEVFWASGSMAGNARSSIFFQQHAHNITFIQTAIRNESRDALLIADVTPQGVEWSAISLTGEEVLAPEEYDADQWWSQRGKKEPFNWRLLPYIILTTLQRFEFWAGAAVGALLILGVGRLLRRGL